MSVYSFLHDVTGKVQLNEALTSTRRHWSTIWEKRLLACLYIHFYIMSRTKFSWTRLWHQQGDIGRQFERKDFWHVCIFIFHFYIMSRTKFSWTRLWHQQGDIGRQFERKDFWHVCIFIFTLCDGQSSVERGFNINKETLVDNLKEKSSGMSVYSFLHYVTDKVQLNEALTSTRRHWSTIWKKKLLACLYIHFYIMSRVKFSWTRL